jgi:hypothetical protein
MRNYVLVKDVIRRIDHYSRMAEWLLVMMIKGYCLRGSFCFSHKMFINSVFLVVLG